MNNINEAVGQPEFLLELHRLTFETIGFDVTFINPDPDQFTLKVVHNNRLPDQHKNSRIEPLIFGSLELFSRFLTHSKDFQKSQNSCITFHPGPIISDSFTVEVNYLNTSKDVIYLEAYCYDDAERLVGKGGTLILSTPAG